MKLLAMTLMISLMAGTAWAGNSTCSHQNRDGRNTVQKDNSKRVATVIGNSTSTKQRQRQKIRKGVKGS